MKKEESTQVYEIYILRKDENHILAMQTDKYDSAFSSWEELSNKWEDAVTRKVPFRINTPIVTAFDPGLIIEITIRPLQISESKNHNPYTKQMMDKGLSSMFGNGQNFNPADILDGGYR